jgi:hypothetical protein
VLLRLRARWCSPMLMPPACRRARRPQECGLVGAPGYPRGFGTSTTYLNVVGIILKLRPKVPRTSPAFSDDATTYKLPSTGSTQMPGAQTDECPPLSVPGGNRIILRFPNDMFTAVHNVWTSDGTGGDGRGYLTAQESYDDGKCYQVNGSPISTMRQQYFTHPMPGPLRGINLWCSSNVTLNDARQQALPPGNTISLY